MFAVAVLEEAAGTCGFCGGGGREETKVGAGMRGSHSLSRETRGLENVLVSMRASVCVCVLLLVGMRSVPSQLPPTCMKVAVT